MKKSQNNKKYLFKYRFWISKCFSNLKIFPNKLKNKINRIQKKRQVQKRSGKEACRDPFNLETQIREFICILNNQKHFIIWPKTGK